MITAAKIQKDIARIEVLMKLSGIRETKLLTALRQECFYALDLIDDQLGVKVFDKQRELATTKMNNYEVAMQTIRQRWQQSTISDLRKKELEKEVTNYYKPDRLMHQIRFLNYILGHSDIIPPELLDDCIAISKGFLYFNQEATN